MGFQANYIRRAFKVQDTQDPPNYINHSYELEVLTKIIFRLQDMDKIKASPTQRSLLSLRALIKSVESNSDTVAEHLVRGYVQQARDTFKIVIPAKVPLLCLAYYTSSVFDHMAPHQARRLRDNDKVDHMDAVGRFLLATVIEGEGWHKIEDPL